MSDHEDDMLKILLRIESRLSSVEKQVTEVAEGRNKPHSPYPQASSSQPGSHPDSPVVTPPNPVGQSGAQALLQDDSLLAPDGLASLNLTRSPLQLTPRDPPEPSKRMVPTAGDLSLDAVEVDAAPLVKAEMSRQTTGLSLSLGLTPMGGGDIDSLRDQLRQRVEIKQQQQQQQHPLENNSKFDILLGAVEPPVDGPSLVSELWEDDEYSETPPQTIAPATEAVQAVELPPPELSATVRPRADSMRIEEEIVVAPELSDSSHTTADAAATESHSKPEPSKAATEVHNPAREPSKTAVSNASTMDSKTAADLRSTNPPLKTAPKTATVSASLTVPDNRKPRDSGLGRLANLLSGQQGHARALRGIDETRLGVEPNKPGGQSREQSINSLSDASKEDEAVGGSGELKYATDESMVGEVELQPVRRTLSKELTQDMLNALLSTGQGARSSSIDEEESVHLVKPWYIVMPGHRLRGVVDYLVLVSLIYVAIVMPIRVAFVEVQYDVWDAVIDLVFGLDIVLSFVTAYQKDNGLWVTDPRRVAWHYVRGWFLIDILSTFPWSLIVQSTTASRLAASGRLYKLLRVFKLLRTVQLVKARRFQVFCNQLKYSPSMHPSVLRMITLILFVMVFAHFVACLWWFVGDGEDNGWIFNFQDSNADFPLETIWDKYVVSLYWAFTVLTTIGFGDIHPYTRGEMAFTIFVMICGVTIFSWVMASLSSILSANDTRNHENRQKLNSLLAFLHRMKVPKNLRRDVVRSLWSEWEKPYMPQQWQDLMAGLPPKLVRSVAAHVHHDLIKNAPFFQVLSDDLNCISHFAAALVAAVFAEGEFVARKGDRADFWYILERGTVDAVSSHDTSLVYLQFRSRDSFGEMSLLSTQHHSRWPAHFRARESSEAFSVTKQRLMRILGLFPVARELMNMLADERTARLSMRRQQVMNMQRV